MTTPAAPPAVPAHELDPRVVVWPASRFVWAVLDVPALRASSSTACQLPDALLPDVQSLCPQPIDEHHCVFVALPATPAPPAPSAASSSSQASTPAPPASSAPTAGRMLVCAVPRAALAELAPHVERLVPDRVPEELIPAGHASPPEHSTSLASSLNLLVGTCEPRPMRARRFKRHAALAATLTACSALVALGLARRALHSDALARSSAQAALAIASSAHTARPSSAPDTSPGRAAEAAEGAALALEADARRSAALLRLARAAAVPKDAIDPLTSIIAAWPLRPMSPGKLLNVSATSDRLLLSLAIAGDPAPFLADLHTPVGWSAAEPRITSVGTVAPGSSLLPAAFVNSPSGVDASTRPSGSSASPSPAAPAVTIARVSLSFTRAPSPEPLTGGAP